MNVLIEEFVIKIQKELEERRVFKMHKIGTFSKGSEGNISFIQDKNYNYNLNSFGMNINHKAKKIKQNLNYPTKSIVKKLPKKDLIKSLTKAAAILIPLIGLSLFSIINEQKINNIYDHMANLNPFAKKYNNKIFNTNQIIDVKKTTIENFKVENEINTVINKKEIYYIIGGAFSEQKNATKLLQKLKKKNYNAAFVEGGKLIRVSYNSFENREEALLALFEIRKENKSAWILTN